jgi:hypothetical protein
MKNKPLKISIVEEWSYIKTPTIGTAALSTLHPLELEL